MPIALTGGPFKNAAGVAVANGVLKLVLSQDAKVTGSPGQIAPTQVSIALNSSGSLVAGTSIYGTDELTPNGLTYTAAVYDINGSRVYGPEFWQPTGGGTLDVGTITPILVSPSLSITPTLPASLFGTFTGGGISGAQTLFKDWTKPNYDGPWNIRQWGAKGDGVTDDTAAIQAALSYFGKGGAGAGQMSQLYFPASAGYKITNMLVFEGTGGVGIRLVGEAGMSLSQGAGSQIQWYGAQGGTMLLMLGANNSSIENLDFIATSGGNSSAASNLVWWDSTVNVTPATYNISAIARIGNIVTATIATHTITAQRIIKIAGSTGGTTSFNGTFQVLYTNDNTHVSWIQLGPNESGNAAGTVTNYQSSSSNGLQMRRVQFSNPKAIVTNISTVSGTNPITVTTTGTHYLRLQDTAIIKSVSDTTYNGVWQVSTIPSSTTATLLPMPGVGQAAADGSGGTGGTIQTDSSAIRFAHKDSNTPQVSSFAGYDLFLQGDQLGGSVSAIRADNGGNTKDFVFYNGNVNGYRYGINSLSSGNLDVDGWTSGLVTPDSTPVLAAIDFLAVGGQVYIKGVEAESTNYRLLAATGGANNTNIHLDAVSYQSTPPTDDVVIASAGTLFISNSYFINGRTSGSVPKIQLSPQFVSGGAQLLSTGNFYSNTATGGAGPNPGYLPVIDSGGNIGYFAGGFYGNRAINITSIGDFGSTDNTNNSKIPLNNVIPMAAVIDSGPGGSTGVAATGFLRMADGSLLNWRNHANSADISLTKNTNDSLTFNGFVMPQVVAKADATAQAANITTTTLYAVPASGAGTYRMSAYVVITQAATTSSTLPAVNAVWTDNDTAVVETFPITATATGNTVGLPNSSVPASMAPFVFSVKASTNIQYSTTNYASVGGTPMQYALHIKLEYLGT